eukprot:gene32271-43097_t
MGSAVSITPDHSQEIALHKLLADNEKLKKLFHTVANSVEEGRINLLDKISVNNLVLYTKNAPEGDFIKLMSADVSVLIEAHRVACGKVHPDQLPFKRFTVFLETLFLFSHLWKYFVIADCVAVDRKIQRGEFVYSKNLVKGVQGFNVADADDEVWAKEFDNIDKHHRGFISFKELCLFSLKNVCTSEDFANYHKEESEESKGTGSAKVSTAAATPSPSLSFSSSSTPAASNNTQDSQNKTVYVSALEAVLAEEERLRREEQSGPSTNPTENTSEMEKKEDKKIRTLLIGLSKAGKSTLMHRLKGNEDFIAVSTKLFNCEDVRYKGSKTVLEVWDLGGDKDAREQWPKYYTGSECILFVVDATDREQIVTASEVLKAALASDELQQAPLLVLANKIDCDGALSSDE